jgi:hypothetical protein
VPSTENYITQAAADARYQALGGLSSATPAQVDAADAGTAGVSSSASRADHEHPVAITAAQLVPAAWLAAWTSYTPTLTQSGAVTKTVTYAKYIQMGKTVIANVILTCTGAGSAANSVIVGLPVTAAQSASQLIGTAELFDADAALAYRAMVMIASTTTVFLRPANSTVSNVLGNTSFTAALASGDVITLTIMYEAA